MASGDEAALLDLRLAEFDVLLGDRIVLLHDQLLGHGARILLGHVIKAGVGARHELDLDGGGPGHFEPRCEFGRTVPAKPQKSRKMGFQPTTPPARSACSASGRTARAAHGRIPWRCAPRARPAPPG